MLSLERAAKSWKLRPLHLAWVSGGLAIIAIALAGALSIWQLRRHEIADAERTLVAFDFLLRDQTERALQSVDLIIQNVYEKIAADGIPTAETYERIATTPDMRDMLRGRTAGVPQLDAVTLINAAGRLLNFSRDMTLPQVNISDRTYFQNVRDDPTHAMMLSEPVENRGNGKWTMYMVRRLTGPDGEFIGMILGAVDLSYFENLYRALQVGDGGAVSLWRQDSLLLARYPPLPQVGKPTPIQSFSGILRTDHPVTYHVDASIDGRARIVATVASSSFPIVVNVTETLDQVLDDWRHFATFIVFGVLLCIFAIITIVLLVGRRFTTYEILARTVAEREAAVAARDVAEEQVRQAQKLEAVGQLTGGIAHDFNNLLTAVLGNIELLKRHAGQDDPRVRRWAQNAYDSAQRGATLTQRLLAFSRRQPLDPRTADVAQVIAAMTDLLRRTLGENIDIVTTAPPDLWPAFVDVNQLDNAILNVAINARDAMKGQGTLRITAANVALDVVDTPAGDYIEIAIGDSGHGIDATTLERVFEPFFTTKPIGQGTGLGLSQVYGFVRQSGGHIRIESAIGDGTIVRIYVPRAAATNSHAAAPPLRADENHARSMRILVVEDDADVRRFTAEILRDLGHDVQQAADGPAALALIERLPPFALLFTDVGLPGMSGRELADHAVARQPSLQVLFTTGYTRNVFDRLGAGAEIITKPFTRHDLGAKIAAMSAALVTT